MKKRSVLAVVSLAAGAVIAAISPPQGADTAATTEPAHAIGALDDSADIDTWVNGTARTDDAAFGVNTSDVSGTQAS
ncbi:hypothetical protein [Streptomyces sp. NPDC048436]|uniref:hypothetical protein n=1 Tax=Streptomyces sp. NPDC048436 TaxID=3365550 RepID=UPI003710DA09